MINPFKKIKEKGIRIQVLNVVMVVAFVIMGVLIIFSNLMLRAEYRRLQEAENEYKEAVDTYMVVAEDDAIQEGENEVAHYSGNVSDYIQWQRILIIFTIVIMAIFALVYHFQVVAVLERYVKNMVRNKPLRERGVYELRYLADAYNENSQKKKKNEEELKKRTDWDGLTGLVSRRAFEHGVEQVLNGKQPPKGAFMLIDVDKFKEINDQYGHDTGDAVLKKISVQLNASFRECDVVGRLGGDEFAIWLQGLPEEHADYIKVRIKSINERLLIPDDGLPSVSLSAGIAFCKENDVYQALYKRADGALGMVKKHGRCGCAVYGDEDVIH